MNKPLVVLIAGGTCSGKSEFVKWFRHSVFISLDRFYLPLPKIPKTETGNLDFDTPLAVGIEECVKAIRTLLKKGQVTVPIYDYVKNDRIGEEKIKLKQSTRYIVVEGMYSFYPPLRQLGNIKIFMDTPSEIRVARRMVRDIKRKKRSHKDTLADFIHAEEKYKEFVDPTKKYADVIIPFSSNPLKFSS